MRKIHPPLLPAAGLLAGAALSLAGCGGSSSEGAATKAAGFPMTFNHDGRTTTLSSPPRVLVKEGEAGAIVAAAGGNTTGKIVALADQNHQPLGPGAATLANAPVISESHDLSKETIVAEKPDLVVAHSFSMTPQDQLDTVGIKSLEVNVCWDNYAATHGGKVDFDAIYSDVLLMGRILGTSSYAERSVARMKATVAAVEREAPSLRSHLPKPTAAFAVLYNGGFFTYGAPSIANTQIQTLGLTNAFGALKARGTQLSAEEFIAKDPGVLVIGYEVGPSGPAATQAQVERELLAFPGINQLTAVREHHVIFFPDNYVLSLAVEGTKLVADQIAAFK